MASIEPLLIMAGGGDGKPLDHTKLERGMASRRGER
jgi:hypothetical protein